MPKSDTWPGGVAMESLSNLDSAGSCDSVISMNSSQDSMEHLSPEERACLMYLEETIEALEVQEDSGFSNDEPDPAFLTGTGANGVPSFKSDASGEDQTSEPESIVFSVLDRAEHHDLNQTSEPGSIVFSVLDRAERHDLNHTSEPESIVFSVLDRAEHHDLHQTSEPQSSTAPAANMKDPETSMNIMIPPKPSVPESAVDGKISPSSSQLCVSKDGDGHLQIVPIASLCPDESDEASEIDVDVIPPPSDFMDEPGLPPETQNVKDLPSSARISHDQPGATVDLEQLRQTAFSKKTSVTQDPPYQPPQLSLPALSPGPLMSPPPEAVEPRSPPAVAPKPKKLPANIILKSHKAAVAVSDDNSEQSVPTSSDRLLLDPQRVHNEALRKLGLLPAEADSGPTLSPSFFPKSRNSWAAPLSPISPRPPHTPPFTPSYTSVNSSPTACVPLQSPAAASPSATSTAPAVQPAEVLPAPDAFSDSVGPPLSAVEDASEATVNAQVSPPPHTPPALVKQLTPPKVVGVKSATLERSGLGLSSYLAGQDSTEAGLASQPHKNRVRQASLGSPKDFASARRESSPVGRGATSKAPELRRSLPGHNAFQHSGDSKKLPRSQGISVLICPRAENEGDRRKALKKLGLLRD